MIIQVFPYNGMTREDALEYWQGLAWSVYEQNGVDNRFLGPAVVRGQFNPNGLPVADF